MKLNCVRWAAWLSFALVLLGEGSARAQDRLPNIVFILADDLGCFELGCYGQKSIRTPQIDRLAVEGMKFNRFYAGNNVCAPSRCSLLTGKHPGHATIRDNREVKPEGQHPLAATDVTLAEILKQKGYATGAIGKWGLGMFGTTGDPLKRGFDFFYGYNCQRHAHFHYPKYLYCNQFRFELPGNDIKTGNTYSHDLFEAESLLFLETHRSRPFFLYLPYVIPHVSLQVPDDSLKDYKGKFAADLPYDGKKGYLPHPTPRAAYAAMVTRMDRTVGRILDKLKELHLDENTLVIFTSDNGPTHNVGGADSTFFESAGPLRGLKGSMYEGGLRVPFLAHWPGKIKPGCACEVPLAFWDVMPTLTALAGAQCPKSDGLSFLPALFGQADQPHHEFLYWESPGYGGQQSVVAGDWKAVRQQLRSGKIKTELYHLVVDLSEKNDVAGQHPTRVTQLEAIMKREHTPSTVFPLQTVDITASKK